MPIVTANGLRLHVQELGEGPPVVMVHGLLIGSLATWYFTAAPVLARSHRVRMFDLRGHGRSERAKTGYDVRSLVGDLAAIAEDLGPVDVVGHSWGALVAIRFALEHAARVRRLAIVEAPLPPSSAVEMTAFLNAEPGRWLDALPAPLRDAAASGRRQADRLIKSLEFLILESSLLDDLRAEPDIPDDALARISCPTLVVCGDQSACLPAGKRIAAAIPGAKLAVLSGGHYIHLDARAELTAALEAHLG
jgi:pimeloyl-ACP methyl ester carboxylesterase